MKLRLLLLGLLVAGTALAESSFPTINSTTPLSLDSLVSLGFQYNPSLRQNYMDTRLNRIGRINAIGNFLPQVSVGMSFSQTHYRSPTFTNPNGSVSTYPRVTYEQYILWDTLANGQLQNPRLSDPVPVYQDVPTGDSRSSSMSLTATENIFEGGRRYFLYRMAKVQEDINNLSVVDARKSLTQSIAQQMVVVLTQQELLDLDKKLRDQQKDAYDLAKARFDVGSVTELDVLQAEIALGTAENAITSAQRALQASKEALNKLLGIDLKSDYPVEDFGKVSPFEFDVDSLINVAYANRTDLQIADLGIQRSRHNLNMSKSDYLPTVSFSASWSRSEASGKDASWTLDPRDESTRYALNLSWNIFDGFSREYNVVTQRVARDKAIESERDLRLTLEKSVHDAYYDLENVFNQLQITERNRDLAQRQLDLQRERYRLGAASALDLRDSQVTYAQAETDHLQKTLQYQSSLIALELAVGKRLR